MGAKEKNMLVREIIIPHLNRLKQHGLTEMDINMCLLGLVMRSMEECVGKEQARPLIEVGMNNVWGKNV